MGKRRERSQLRVFQRGCCVTLRVYSAIENISMKIADVYTKFFKIACSYLIFVEKRNFIFCTIRISLRTYECDKLFNDPTQIHQRNWQNITASKNENRMMRKKTYVIHHKLFSARILFNVYKWESRISRELIEESVKRHSISPRIPFLRDVKFLDLWPLFSWFSLIRRNNHSRFRSAHLAPWMRYTHIHMYISRARKGLGRGTILK